MATPLASPMSFAALAGTRSLPSLLSVYWQMLGSKCVKSLPLTSQFVDIHHFPFLAVIKGVRLLPQLALQETDRQVHSQSAA